MDLESRIRERGRELYALSRGGAPVIFHKGWWMGKLLNRCMQSERFKVQLFRFVDVFPLLEGSESLLRHIQEYFEEYIGLFPSLLKWGKGGLRGAATGKILAQAMRMSILAMARQFIIGEDGREALRSLRKLRRGNFAFTVDILGEASVSELEAERYLRQYLQLLEELDRETRTWEPLGSAANDLDWGYSPKLQVSVKATGLYSQASPIDFEGSVDGICARLEPILRKAQQLAAVVYMDMEQYRTKAILIEVYKRLLSNPDLGVPRLGIVLQSYLRETDRDLEELLNWSGERRLPLSIRLVKGAYWDYETILSAQHGWRTPVYLHKAETDAAFERLARKILENHELCYLACGSHNIRSISAVLETARAFRVPDKRYEFQTLYGMAEPVRRALLKAGLRVRVYCPYGDLLPGMAYLVRRLLENTSNESFLRRGFVENMDTEELLENPGSKIPEADVHPEPAAGADPDPLDFTNEPQADFTQPEVRSEFRRGLEEVRGALGRVYPLLIGGREVRTSDTLDSLNPANPSEVVGRVCQSGTAEIDSALAAAAEAFPAWSRTPAEERARVLFRAADLARGRIYTLAAWQVLEVGKQWDQAYADVTEAIDFLEYYGKEMVRLSEPRRMGRVPGEVNRYFYEPRGQAAVIAPWNFPMAISCGMCSAAVVTGNCVLYKPSGLSSVVGFTLARLFEEAGAPPGVFNFVPGRSKVMGDYLVDHPEIGVIAFTGSLEVGLRIIGRGSRVHPMQEQVKRVIAEMGGKNAVIIDDDADLDEAVIHVVQSAFGFQGQKCSACSRVIVVRSIYDRFVSRLVEAAGSIRIGPAEDPANQMGPVVEKAAQERILEYIEVGKKEGTPLLIREVPSEGFYAPMAIFADIGPDHRLAREEIFGPVLSVMRAGSFSEAVEIANSTKFALTGGVFSRSPQHLEQAGREFRVGNLYLNRGITGALVGRQPFGGFKLSGVGSKTGGPDYLVQFMNPRCITENTMRRGFAPSDEGI
jgi:RHH-type proline utilization regulon transcriptional repressor/proline dehydrogenase/delta 1-pyrroline-5-carboxylate dehydrogenase